MKITEANFLAYPDEGIDVLTGGQPARIQLTKKSLLDEGIAIVEDRDDAQPIWSLVSYPLPRDPSIGRGETLIEGGTVDPIIVCLARRYWKAVNSENFAPGPVPIPTHDEALAELNNPKTWKKGI